MTESLARENEQILDCSLESNDRKNLQTQHNLKYVTFRSEPRILDLNSFSLICLSSMCCQTLVAIYQNKRSPTPKCVELF